MKVLKIFFIGGLALSFTVLHYSYAQLKQNYTEQSKNNLKEKTIIVQANQNNQEVVSTEEIEPEQEEPYQYINIDVCSSSSSKTYMDYKAITNTSSKQYKFIKDFMYVDQTNGLLRYNSDNEFIGVALGSYFGGIGSMYRITLENENVLNVIKIDEKADNHTNYGCEQKWDKSVIEFVIDSQYAKPVFGGSNGYVANGNFNNIEQFKGKIIKIERVIINE